jgi:hypothetical protein
VLDPASSLSYALILTFDPQVSATSEYLDTERLPEELRVAVIRSEYEDGLVSRTQGNRYLGQGLLAALERGLQRITGDQPRVNRPIRTATGTVKKKLSSRSRKPPDGPKVVPESFTLA